MWGVLRVVSPRHSGNVILAPCLEKAAQEQASFAFAQAADHLGTVVADRLLKDPGAVVDAATLLPVSPLVGEIRALTATRFGKARLLDNRGTAVPTLR